MNAIIVSTLLGVIMMFVSWGTSNTKLQRNIGLVGLLVLILANIAQMNGWLSVNFDTKGMLAFNAIGLYVNTILFTITFIYLWINGEEIDKIGNHTADYYAIFFFILCGISILTSFDNLLILDTGGFPIYYGNPVESVIYFKQAINHVTANESECFHCGNVNPEQIFNIVEAQVLDEYGKQTHTRKTTPLEWQKHFNHYVDKGIKGVSTNGNIPKISFKIPNSFPISQTSLLLQSAIGEISTPPSPYFV